MPNKGIPNAHGKGLKMYIGVDYYPEHWPRERWQVDARLMEDAGFNVARLAEFAWVFMEPEEGRFEFDWLDEAIDTLGRHGVSVILGTPTAAMPAWVARKYPETLAMRRNGTRVTWGVRKNNCLTSDRYRLLSKRITRAMAEHFGSTPNVIGWQTDNELGDPVCYCGTCRKGFQDWLRTKYGTLDDLNKRWGTHFWGQRYGAWEEIQLPEGPDDFWEYTGGGHLSTHNPSLCLDWRRYQSWLNVHFQREQVSILREVCPGQFVTHNLMGLYSELNYYDLAADLDFVSWDNYPVWGAPDIPYGSSAGAAVMRGLKRRNVWVMEQTAGPSGWSAFGRNPRPGELRKIAYQQVAAGADAIIWFRWRTCTAGREQYWHGLLGHDGKPLRRYREAAQTARELHALAKELEGTTVKSDVAIVYDYDSIWALSIQPGFVGNSYHAAMMRYYSALFRAGVNVDMISATADLSQYRLVIAPDFNVVPDGVSRALAEYVSEGGVLMADCRLAVKDESNLCHECTLPGALSEVLGISIEEYEALDDHTTYRVVGESALGGEFTSEKYVDWVTQEGAEALARYDQWHLKQFAAVTRNHFGRGAAYYVGTWAKEEAFYDLLIAELLHAARVEAPMTPPPGVEVSVRQDQSKRLLFMINHTEERQCLSVPSGVTDVLSGTKVNGKLELDPYGVAVALIDGVASPLQAGAAATPTGRRSA